MALLDLANIVFFRDLVSHLNSAKPTSNPVLIFILRCWEGTALICDKQDLLGSDTISL